MVTLAYPSVDMAARKQRKYGALGERIAELRERAGLTQREMAERADISDGYPPKIESGENRPTPERLRRIARVVGADYAELAQLAGYADAPIGEITMTVTEEEAAHLRALRAISVPVRRITRTIQSMYRADDELFYDLDGSKDRPPTSDAGPPSQ